MMIADTIDRIQKLEQQIGRATPAELRARLAMRSCLRDLRGLDQSIDVSNITDDEKIIRFRGRAPSVSSLQIS